MATLEKIRSKSVLLIVIIGVALLAFIVGDALTNSRNLFGDHTTVAKIGDAKIDYTEYQRKREELSHRLEQARQQNPQQFAGFDTQILSQMAIDELVGTALLDKAVDRVGLRTSPEQLRYYVLENPVNRDGMQEIIMGLQKSGVSVMSPSQAYEVIFNPTRNGLTEAQMEPFQRAWVAMEAETAKIVNRNAYQRLLFNTVKANDLDKKALYDDYIATTQIDLVYRPYGQLDEKEYPVSSNEVAEAYSKHKGEFKVDEPTKTVSFIAVPVVPSQADRKQATELSHKTLAALKDSASNSKNLPADLRKEGVSSSHRELRASDVAAGPVKTYVAEAAPGAVQVVTDNMRGFTIVKMGRKSYEVDSIQLNIVQVVGETLPAKVLASLNGGLAIDSLASAFPKDSVASQKEQWLPLFSKDGRTNAIEKGQLDSLNMAPGRYIRIVDTPQGAILAKVTAKSSPKEIVSFDEVTYQLNPSTKTVNDERTKLEKFLLANQTAKDFAANAAKEGFNVQEFEFTQSTPAVPRMRGYNQYYPESRQVVRWVMIDGKPGQVSQVYESKDATAPMLYAVAVDSEYSDYKPVASPEVDQYLTDLVRREKAGKALVKKYSGKTLAEVASKMGVEPRQLPTVRMGRGSGIADPTVLGTIAGSKPGSKVVVVEGKDGVYGYVVTGNAKENFPYNDQQYEQQYFQMINPDLGSMLKGASKLDNRAYKFEAGE